MKFISKFTAWFIPSVIIMSYFSCAPAYVPNVVNSPLLSNSGEFKFGAAVGTSVFDPQLAIAVTDHVGVMANGSFGTLESGFDDTTQNKDFQKHSIVEVGAGYYTITEEKLRFEIYGGFGYGKVTGKFSDYFFSNLSSDAIFKKMFIQPAVGYCTNYFEASFSSRLSYIDMDLIRNDKLFNDKYSIFAEPAATIKFGAKNVKLMVQAGLSFPIVSTKLFEYNPIMFSLGLHFNLGRKNL